MSFRGLVSWEFWYQFAIQRLACVPLWSSPGENWIGYICNLPSVWCLYFGGFPNEWEDPSQQLQSAFTPNDSSECTAFLESLEWGVEVLHGDSVALLGIFNIHIGNDWLTWKGVIERNSLPECCPKQWNLRVWWRYSKVREWGESGLQD